MSRRSDREHVWGEFQPNYQLVTGLSNTIACPICLKEVHFDSFSVDHAPPRRIGGRIPVPSCRECNSRAGSELERHLDRFLRRKTFEKQYAGREPWILTIGGERASSAIAVNEESIDVIVREDYPGGEYASKVVYEQFRAKSKGGRWHGASMDISTDMKLAYSSRHLNLVWLKAAYLSLLWFLGYGAILRPAYDRVRQQLAHPNEDIVPLYVGGHAPLSPERQVMAWYIYDPSPAFLVYFQGFKGDRDAAVLLPSPSDEHLDHYRVAVASAKPGARFMTIGFPPDAKERGKDGLTLVSEDTGREHVVYEAGNGTGR